MGSGRRNQNCLQNPENELLFGGYKQKQELIFEVLKTKGGWGGGYLKMVLKRQNMSDCFFASIPNLRSKFRNLKECGCQFLSKNYNRLIPMVYTLAKYRENCRKLLYPTHPTQYIHPVCKLMLRTRLLNLSLDHEWRLYG